MQSQPWYLPIVAVPWQFTSVQPLPVDMSLHHRTAPATPWEETCSSTRELFSIFAGGPQYDLKLYGVFSMVRNGSERLKKAVFV
jgi:hypothetical protein